MMKRTLAALVMAGVILPVAGYFTATQLQAQPLAFPSPLAQAPDRQPGRGDRSERWLEELDLSEDQITRIRAIRESAREDMRAQHESLRAAKEQLHTLMAGDTSDDALRAQHQVVQDLHRQVADARFEVMLATREVLTPAQRAELATLTEQRRAERRENRTARRGDRGGHHAPF